VQREHPTLALRVELPQGGLTGRDDGRIEAGDQPVRVGPGAIGGVPCDHMEPDAEADHPTPVGRESAHPLDLLGHQGRWLPR
jgi:hypothetical protein